MVEVKKIECCVIFSQESRQVPPNEWTSAANVIRGTGKWVLGVLSGKRRVGKET